MSLLKSVGLPLSAFSDKPKRSIKSAPVVHYNKQAFPSFRIVAPFFLAFFLWGISSHAQERCATIPYLKSLIDQGIRPETSSQFEEWLSQKILNRAIRPLKNQRTGAAKYQVPVVVHIIHNGEPIGTGANIPDAQVFSQLTVLNNDFKRLNADATNTPLEFMSMAGAMDIEFVLARRNPEGFATTGINRLPGTKTEWSYADMYELKSLSYWPAEDYLNLWVVNLTKGNFGFAQFPVSNLPGLSGSSQNRLTDGAVIDHAAFGSIDHGAFALEPNYNKGRTTTHEIGHFLGLHHIWGDDNGSCTGTDYVDDTPNQADQTNYCPTHPQVSCTLKNMFQDYMDYTYDACMNLFTVGQMTRMVTVLENSPRRASLLTSPALLTPITVANDLGIRAILSPTPNACQSSVTPTLEIRNYGNNTITSAQISIKKNGMLIETLPFSVSLLPLDMATVSFSLLPLGPGASDITFDIIQVNGVPDGYAGNNIKTVQATLQQFTALPFSEPFNALPSSWRILNYDNKLTWKTLSAPLDNPSNMAIAMNFFNYADNYGENDVLLTPVFDLSTVPVAFLSFDVAYARFSAPLSNDGLKVVVLTNCGHDLLKGTPIYQKAGAALETSPPTSVEFFPTGVQTWRKEFIDLSAFVGQSQVQLAFIGINDYGNNLFLDNISVLTSAFEDVAITETLRPSPVTCMDAVDPLLRIQNYGTKPILNFGVDYAINGSSPLSMPISGINLKPGEAMTVALPSIPLNTGINAISVNLVNPNGTADATPLNNFKEITCVKNTSRDRVPLRENFDGNILTQWTSINPTKGMAWETVPTHYHTSYFFNGFSNPLPKDEAWLVSPVLDFSKAPEASLFFDLSYAQRLGRNDRLRVLTSTDCGLTFTKTAWDKSGVYLSGNYSNSSWIPLNEQNWGREQANLNHMAGEKNARIAFVLTNDNGNNTYLDNLEFFVDDNPNPPKISPIYALYYPSQGENGDFYLTFNLPHRSTVGYQIMDRTGKVLVDENLGDVLNQTFLVNFQDAATGIYIVRLYIDGKYYPEKIFISR